MNYTSNIPGTEVLLQTNASRSINLPLVRNLNEIISILIEISPYKKEIHLCFQNEVTTRDANFLVRKRKQFKQKQYEKIFQGAVKILKSYPNYLLGYLFAGAAAFKNRKNKDTGPFYLSCAAMINPNCFSAWEGLQKHCRDNVNNPKIVFETVFCGYLLNERNLDKWQKTISYILDPEICYSSRNPLPIIAPFLQHHYYCDDNKKIFIAEVLSYYLFHQGKYIKHANDFSGILPQIAVEAFLVHCNNVKDVRLFYSKALAFLFNVGAYRYINVFILRTINQLQDLPCLNVEFIFGIINFLFVNNLDPSYQLIRKLMDIIKLTKALEKWTPRAGFILILICKALCDNRRVLDCGEKIKKGHRFLWKLKIVIIWSYIYLQDFETAWTTTLLSISKNVSLSKGNKNMILQKRNVAHLHLSICLYLLTHGPNKLMQKLGLLLCLKLINNKIVTIELLFFACIASIMLNEYMIGTFCLHKLSRLGAFNEIVFLKSLLEESYTCITMYLKEIQDFRYSHLLAAVLSSKFENKSKSLKSFYKASVMVPDCVFLYEWLGIYSYESHDLSKSKLYFEIALFYNPHSWTSINFYASLLELDDLASSKLFLSLYNFERKQHLSFLESVHLKAGLLFFKYKSSKEDYFKACEYFRRCLRRYPQNRYYKEMLAESYSKFGMIGSGLKCFKECYIINKCRYLYSGSMLGKQYLFVKGGTKYVKIMKYVTYSGRIDAFIALHNAAHAFLIRSIQLSTKKHLFLSQIYCQQALFFCVRALSVSTNFSSIWKLMGDILFQCSCLSYSAGFLYIPYWLVPEHASNKLILIRRFQSALLAIRCYYAGLNTQVCTNEVQVCLWNSIAVTLRKLSFFCNKDCKQKILRFGIQCCAKGLKINVYNSMSWNTLGVLMNDLSSKNHKVAQKASFIALSTSLNLSTPIAYSLYSTCNAGFIAVSMFEYEKAYKLFLSARGTFPSFDIPWVGDMLLHLVVGNINIVIQDIVYLYLLTKHSPTLRSIFMSVLLLSPFSSDKLISYIGKKYRCYLDDGLNFKSYFLSGMIKSRNKNCEYALRDFIFGLRTCIPQYNGDFAVYQSIAQDLYFCLRCNKMKSTFLNRDHFGFDKSISLLLCENFLCENRLERAYIELLKGLKLESNECLKMLIYYAIAVINYKGNQCTHSKYYYLKGLFSD